MSTAIHLVRQAVPAPLRPQIARLWHGTRARWQGLTERLAAGSHLGAGLYYGAISGAFSREHRAVAAGRAAYRAGLRAERRSSYLLRRNIHRLEKGLVAQDRRPVFALDYIGETVAEFEAVARTQPGSPLSAELKWARDVLAAYFAATDATHPRLAKLGAKYRRIAAGVMADTGPPSIPFLRDLDAQPVAIGALERLAIRRRSVRSYLARPMNTPETRALVDRAMAVAAQSPSACNRQAFRFLLFDTPETARRVAAIPAGTKTFVAGLQAVAVVVGRLGAYPRERDRHAIYVDGSLAAMGFIYGLETQGLASCAINWADEEPAERRIARLLDLTPDERVILMIAYGWPDPAAPVPYSAKRPLDEIREYDHALHSR